MLPEQQQRILGYFIEEARDHLNTIEQGLLNLQATLDDQEMINEVFRAAHSIKGGAAMLGLISIQRTSHRLEDCFKVLKDNPIQVDQKLESLFLGVSDTLKALLEHLSGPFGLSEEAASTLMSEAEPVFGWLNEHLESLLGQQGNTNIKVSTDDSAPVHIMEPVVPDNGNAPSAENWQYFQTAVLQKLRDMLQLFKQNATTESRKGLEACCQYLAIIGEDLKLTNWGHLCRGAASAVINVDNSYLNLAKVIITEIKTAQELALAGRDAEITISPQLEVLIALPDIDLLELSSDFFDNISDDDNYNDNTLNAAPISDFAEIQDLNQLSAHALDSHAHEYLNENDNRIRGSEINTDSEISSLFELSDLNIEELDINGDDNIFAHEYFNENDNRIRGSEINTQEEISSLLELSDFNIEELDINEFSLGESDGGDNDIFAHEYINENDNRLRGLEINTQEEISSRVELSDLNMEELDINESYLGEDNIDNQIGSLFELDVETRVVQYKVNSPFEMSDSLSDDSKAPTNNVILDLHGPEVGIAELSELDELFKNDVSELDDTWHGTQVQVENDDDLEVDNIDVEFNDSEINDLLVFADSTNFYVSPDANNAELTVVQLFGSFLDDEELVTENDDTPIQAPVESVVDYMDTASAHENVAVFEFPTSNDARFDDLFIDESQYSESSGGANELDDLFTATPVEFTFNDDVGLELEESLFAATFHDQNFITTKDTKDTKEEKEEFENDNFFALQLNDSEIESLGAILDFDSIDNTPEGAKENSFLSGLTEVQFRASETLLSNDLISDFEFEADSGETALSYSDSVDNIVDPSGENELERSGAILEFDSIDNTFEGAEENYFDNFLTEVQYRASETLLSNDLISDFEFEADSGETALSYSDSVDNIVDPSGENELERSGAILEFDSIDNTRSGAVDNSFDNLLTDVQYCASETLPENDLISDSEFEALSALLGEAAPNFSGSVDNIYVADNNIDSIDDFGDLEKMLADTNDNVSASANNVSVGKQRPVSRRTARFEQLMKVSVKHLDDMSNLVGELVVNRNTLEQDQERLRQSLDNLLIQIHHLSDVGARMQELYERSLLEASLLATRKSGLSLFQTTTISNKDSERGFSELEMDRFTPFHTLSQEMIELIVRVRESASDIDFVTEETERVARQFRQVTTQLQEGLTKARMVAFSQVTDRVKRGVRDNAIKCGKQVELLIEGQDTLIDKMILEHLTDPLIHMLNNAIAHGIETPEERVSKGKQPVGIITVRAFHQGNQTVISVSDDGAGINADYVKQKAIKVGLITPEQGKTISRMEIYELLFQPNFSTKDKADDLAGRGVGMDVVRTSISEIRGTITTDSTVGKGTSFTIRLPLTLSICKALCCVWDKARIAFPMDGVEDTLDISVKSIQRNEKGESYIMWRDTKLPFKPLKDILTLNRQLSRGSVYGGTRDDDMVSVVVIRSASTMIGLQVDSVLSEQEIVIKQFEGPAPKPIGVAGATVLGDGRIMPIADVLEIIDIFQGRTAKQSPVPFFETSGNNTESTGSKIDPTVLIVDDSITVRELLSLSFNKAGYRVEQARDGQEAWEKLRSGLPCDIVFCDIEMPRCDGLELLSRISKEPSLSQLPIAMLTSRGADKHKQMAINLGASGYFTKPYLEEALLEAAGRMLKGEKLVGNGNG